jgi:hypothetical protein
MTLRDVRRERGIPQCRLAGLASVPRSKIMGWSDAGCVRHPGRRGSLLTCWEWLPETSERRGMTADELRDLIDTRDLHRNEVDSAAWRSGGRAMLLPRRRQTVSRLNLPRGDFYCHAPSPARNAEKGGGNVYRLDAPA